MQIKVTTNMYVELLNHVTIKHIAIVGYMDVEVHSSLLVRTVNWTHVRFGSQSSVQSNRFISVHIFCP